MRKISGLRVAAFSLRVLFGVLVTTPILGVGIAADVAAHAREERMREERLAKVAHDAREIVCLTNIVIHEVLNQSKDVRALTGKTVLAMASDNTSRTHTVCDLGKVKGMFSAIKNVDTSNFPDAVWLRTYWEMSDVYFGDRTLPRGWHCVRNFRLSDEKLSTLNEKSLAQLGITPDRKGLEFFDRKTTQVAVHEDIAFFAPKKGCKKPSRTF